MAVKREDRIERYTADLVVVAAGRSTRRRCCSGRRTTGIPRGLANGSGRGGPPLHGPRQQRADGAEQVPEPHRLPEDAGGERLLLRVGPVPPPDGAHLVRGQARRGHLARGRAAIAPGWTLELMARHSLDFWLTSEDLPDPENRVTLDREGNIVLSYRPNNQEGHPSSSERSRRSSRRRAPALRTGSLLPGAFSRNLFLGQRIPLAGVAHQNGTIRFGRDPRTSALDVNCRRTRWTTSTWSTGASSPRARR